MVKMVFVRLKVLKYCICWDLGWNNWMIGEKIGDLNVRKVSVYACLSEASTEVFWVILGVSELILGCEE